MPAPFVDTIKHVASTRPVEAASERTALSKNAIPLADDLATASGSDWASFLGPNGTSTTSEAFPLPTPIKVQWQTDVGDGYAAPAIIRGRVIVLDRVKDRVRCRALRQDTGKELWQFTYNSDYLDKQGWDGGPRSSPVSDGARLFIHGPEGMLHCLRVSDGSLLWKCDTANTFGVVQNIFGVGSTPLLFEDKLLVQIGGSPAGTSDKDFMTLPNSGSAIVAFDQATGEVRYQCGNELASYASPQIIQHDNRSMGILFARGGILGFDPLAGKELFRHPYRARSYNSVNACNALAQGNQLFITESYEVGSSLFDVKMSGITEKWKASFRSKTQGVACHWSTPVLINGHIYGCTSRHRNDAELRCVEWATGKVKWIARPQLQDEIAGRGSLIVTADNQLLYWCEEGWLFAIRANPVKYEQTFAWDATTVAPQLKHPCWTGPCLSRGMLFVRGKGALLALVTK
jgi:outer membrane protein assembly factor BamB